MPVGPALAPDRSALERDVRAAAAQAGFGESWPLGLRLLQSAAAAALAVAVEPTLVACTHLLWPETIYTPLVSCVFAAVPGLERDSVPRRLLVGAAIGAALLLKPVFGLIQLTWFASLLLAGVGLPPCQWRSPWPWCPL